MCRCIVLLLVISFAALPAQAAVKIRVGKERERKLGKQASEEIDRQLIIRDDRVADKVQEIGQRLVKALDKPEWEFGFKVIDEREVNAFALPGGFIYVFTGLAKAARTEDELAAVLAHEITHAQDRHWAKQYEKQSTRDILITGILIFGRVGSGMANLIDVANFAIGQRYSRKDEQSADDKGMELMAAAGYKPEGMVALLENLDKFAEDYPKLLRWMSDHPAIPNRIAKAKAHVEGLKKRPPGSPAPAPSDNGSAPSATGQK